MSLPRHLCILSATEPQFIYFYLLFKCDYKSPISPEFEAKKLSQSDD